ncbi:MAG: glutamate 5-kinase [Polyangiaceae bacterium]
MTSRSPERAALTRARRVVVKIGSRTLATDADVFGRLASSVKAARDEGRSVVLVSSGAIALGVKRLGYRSRPKELGRLQAAAAAGQTALMRAYEKAFEPHGLTVAQVLLTHADLSDRHRANNARAALSALLDAGAVPVLNENDSVSVEEIKFGDNDQLAAMVTPLVDADVLLLLSDVTGLLDGEGRRVGVVRDVATDALPHLRATKSSDGTGGMASKVEAARRATLAGAAAIVADARDPEVVGSVLAGKDVGTLFVPGSERLTARRYWIAFTLRPHGDVVVDPGAREAVLSKKKSVLAVGVLGVRGSFRSGDAVRVLDGEGKELARGLARMGSDSIASSAGKKADDTTDGVVVHKDDLVVVV